MPCMTLKVLISSSWACKKSDVQVCHQRLSSAFDLLLIFLCSLIQTLTLTPPPNNALLANMDMRGVHGHESVKIDHSFNRIAAFKAPYCWTFKGGAYMHLVNAWISNTSIKHVWSQPLMEDPAIWFFKHGSMFEQEHIRTGDLSKSQ